MTRPDPLRLVLASLVVLAGVLASSAPGLAVTGLPDCFGYTWTDQNSGCSAAVPRFQGAPTAVPGARAMVGPVSLGFTMPYYGQPVSQVWISPSGYVTFSAPAGVVQTTTTLPDTAVPNNTVAAYWMPVYDADITYEATPGTFHVQWVQRRTRDAVLTSDVHLLINSDGSMRILWPTTVDVGVATVGHENAAGDCGRTMYRDFTRETGTGGSFPFPGSGIGACIQPPALLDCSSPTVVSCGSSVASTLPAADPSPAFLYGCNDTSYLGNERVFRVDVASAQRVTVEADDPALTLLQVGDAPCDEANCIRVGTPNTLTYPVLFPGSYWFVVDKETAGGGTSFNFRATCVDPFERLACGDTVPGNTAGMPGVFDSHTCAAPVLDGPEGLYRVTLPTTDSLIATLDGPTPDLWVLIYDAASFDVDGSGCLASGVGGAGAFDLPAGDYVIMIDSAAGGGGPFDLTVTCGKQLDCTGATQLACRQTASGDTRTSPERVAVYGCSSDALTGGEDVYRFFNPLEQTVAVRFISSQPGQRLILLPACDEGQCLLSGDSAVSCALFPPGEYLVVVDGPRSSEGPYELEVVCSEFFAGTNLRVTGIDASALTGDCDTFDVDGTATVGVTNLGDTPARAPFEVVVFEDGILNGDFDDPGDNILGRHVVSSDLPPGETLILDVAASGTLAFRDNVLYAIVDPDGAVSETDETDNIFDTGRACEFRPPVGEFSPTVEWWWDGLSTAILPSYREVDTIPLVGDVDGDGIPNVVINTGPTQFADGVVRVLDGRDGTELWTADAPNSHVWSSSNLAIGDIDGDVGLEVIGHSAQDTNRLVAIDDDGTFLWQSEPFLDHPAGPTGGTGGGGAPSIADLDCDGLPEIVYGANAFTASGGYFWRPEPGGTRGINDGGDGALSVVVDVDLDGQLEVVAGPTVYKYNAATGIGDILWTVSAVPDGTAAIGNFDEDDLPEVALTASGTVYVLDGDSGRILWQRDLPCGPTVPGGCTCNQVAGGPPTVADFDGDCVAEIGVAGADRYVVFETDGTIKWASPIDDCSSHRTASTVFDFDGDGAAEVAFMDETNLHVFRGFDGTELARLPAASHTWVEMVSIADVDADNNAEIIIPLNPCFAGPRCSEGRDQYYGVQVVGDADDNWVNTRRIWNQHQYHIDNVLDDGRIPGPFTNGQCEGHSWLRHNTYRDQIGTAIYTAADITISIVETEVILTDDCFRDLRIVSRIGNGGGINVGTSFWAIFFDGDPAAGGTELARRMVDDLQPGEYVDFEVTVPFPRFGTAQIFALADDDGTGRGLVNECNETNNVCVVTVENSPQPIDPPASVGDGLRVRDHGDPEAASITAVLDWTLDFGAPRTLGTGRAEEHFHVLRGTSPLALSALSAIEPWLSDTYPDSTPRQTPPFVHFYKVIAADGCEQLEQ